jgi:hypothetical protein
MLHLVKSVGLFWYLTMGYGSTRIQTVNSRDFAKKVVADSLY